MLQGWLFGLIAPLCIVIFTILAWVYYGRAEAKKLAWQATLWLVVLKQGTDEEVGEVACLFYAFLPLLAHRGLPTFKQLVKQSLDNFGHNYSAHKAEMKASLIMAKRNKE